MHADRALAKVSRDMERWARKLYREKAEMDYYSEMYCSREQGKAEGRAEGLALGEAAGLAQGIVAGKAEEKLEIARRLKARGVPEAEIAEITGLPPEAIEP